MDGFLLLLLLIALVSLPAVLIIIGLHRLNKENGIICFMVGTGLYAFSIPGAFISHDVFSFLVSVMVLYLCYRFYRWLGRRRSREYIDFLSSFLSYVEDPHLPSCAPYILSKLTDAVNSSPDKALAGDIATAVVNYVFNLSYGCLGSTDFRDLFYELNSSGLQMLNICFRCNSYLFEHKVISEQVYKGNEEAISEMQVPLIHM